jgi:hypothetical protein
MEQLEFLLKNFREAVYKRKFKVGYNCTKYSVLPVIWCDGGKGAARIIKEQ